MKQTPFLCPEDASTLQQDYHKSLPGVTLSPKSCVTDLAALVCHVKAAADVPW